jgi:predicted RNase H-like HicB family nuclease
VVNPVRYRVVFDRDVSAAWIVRVPAVSGCHSYGRSLDEARARIREALALWVDDVAGAHLDEEVRPN